MAFLKLRWGNLWSCEEFGLKVVCSRFTSSQDLDEKWIQIQRPCSLNHPMRLLTLLLRVFPMPRPLFCGNKRLIQKSFAPIQLPFLIQCTQRPSLDFKPYLYFFPLMLSSPASGGLWYIDDKSFHLAPLCSTHKIPSKHARSSTQVRVPCLDRFFFGKYLSIQFSSIALPSQTTFPDLFLLELLIQVLQGV